RREQLLGGLLAGSPDRLRLAAAVDALAKIAAQVSPADLALFRRQAVVRPPTVAADDPRDRLAQQRLEPFPIPPRVDHEERHRGGRGRPAPPPGAGLLPARLVYVLGRGRADRLTGLVVGRGQRRGRLALQRPDRTQREGDAQGVLNEFLHPAAAEVMAAD